MDGLHDAATDLVVEALRTAHVPVFRMDTAQFPREVELRGHHNGPGAWSGTLATAHRSVELADIRAVYWNRPNQVTFPDLSASDAHWARGAARIGFGGILTGLAAGWPRWMNHPSHAAAAEFKPEQLRTASNAGLDTPRTLITNCPDAVTKFAKDIQSPIITKPMGIPYIAHESIGVETMYTRVVDLNDLNGIETTAHLFQEWIEGIFEIRLFSIGGTCHSVRIDAHSEAASLDWRTDYDALSYSAVETPQEISQAVTTYMEAMRLTYAAFDFIVRPDGRWTFLEANPSGQWAWLNDQCALADAIANTLKGWCTS
ncbi:MvdC/MvdD family ATP grasp protein [Streptomyces sp. NPDC005962]|uniref:MvdC/MvdD family ATP grasp protein n=1 Tax=Streptomyces sp. NPDC005962 TaxID=3154466 RepID=UPI0033ED6A8D